MKLLHIDASILGERSVSRQLTAAIVERLVALHPAANVVHNDLSADPAGHLSAVEYMAFQGAEPQDYLAKQHAARNARWLDEFLAADVIVVGAPMYNFSLPTQLKAWLDRLAVANKTFAYSERGTVEGLAGGKRVIVASSRGGLYSPGAPAAFLDHQETYLRGFFGFLGITDVTFIRAEGLSLAPQTRSAAIEAALSDVSKLAA